MTRSASSSMATCKHDLASPQRCSIGNKRGMTECLAGLASVAAEKGHAEWAPPLLWAAQALLTSFGAAWWPADRVGVIVSA